MSANYRGGFIIRYNLSIYSRGVKNSFGNAGERDGRWKKKKVRSYRPTVIVPIKLTSALLSWESERVAVNVKLV